MKEMMEEYGGVIAASILGLSILGMIGSLLGNGGGLSHLVLTFLRGIGTVVC